MTGGGPPRAARWSGRGCVSPRVGGTIEIDRAVGPGGSGDTTRPATTTRPTTTKTTAISATSDAMRGDTSDIVPPCTASWLIP